MVLMAFFYLLNIPFGMLTLLLRHTVFCVPYILMEVRPGWQEWILLWRRAAKDLGAESFRTFRDITLPLIMPAVVSGSLLAFAMSMDDVVISIFAQRTQDIHTSGQGVYTAENRSDTGDKCFMYFNAGFLQSEYLQFIIWQEDC